MEYFYLGTVLVIFYKCMRLYIICTFRNKYLHRILSFYKISTVMINFSLTQANAEMNPEFNTLINDSRYIAYPQEVYLDNNIWYTEDENKPYTGKIFIYQRKNINYRVAICMVSDGMRNGMFTQNYNERDKLPGISGIYIDNKMEGVWTWVYPDSALIIKNWKDSELFKITSIDYRRNIKHGSVIVQKSQLINYDSDQRLYVPRKNIYLQGEYVNGIESGEWLYNDYERDVTNMIFYWSRKIQYKNGILIDEKCREPWGIVIGCEEYYEKYVTPEVKETGESNKNFQDTQDKRGQNMATLIDDMGEKVEMDINNFISHIKEYHGSKVSVHKEGDFFFTIDDEFRLMLKNLIKY